MLTFEGRDASTANAPVPIGQVYWEFNELVGIYCGLSPRRVLEIGTLHGGTLYYWLKYAVQGAKIVSVDDRKSNQGIDERTWETWAPDGVELVAIDGKSDDPEVIDRVAKELLQVDFMFIDGDHTYEGARADWENYSPMVPRGGVVSFHDLIAPRPQIGVPELWREIQALGYVTQELRSHPEQKWGGIGVIYL